MKHRLAGSSFVMPMKFAALGAIAGTLVSIALVLLWNAAPSLENTNLVAISPLIFSLMTSIWPGWFPVVATTDGNISNIDDAYAVLFWISTNSIMYAAFAFIIKYKGALPKMIRYSPAIYAILCAVRIIYNTLLSIMIVSISWWRG